MQPLLFMWFPIIEFLDVYMVIIQDMIGA